MEISEDCGDKPNLTQLAHQIKQLLAQSDDVAYKIYLLLSTKFGAGQKILS